MNSLRLSPRPDGIRNASDLVTWTLEWESRQIQKGHNPTGAQKTMKLLSSHAGGQQWPFCHPDGDYGISWDQGTLVKDGLVTTAWADVWMLSLTSDGWNHLLQHRDYFEVDLEAGKECLAKVQEHEAWL